MPSVRRRWLPNDLRICGSILPFCRVLLSDAVVIAVALLIPLTRTVAQTPAPGVTVCVGDCNQDRMVTVDEVVIGVGIALGTLSLATCPEFRGGEPGTVSIDDIIKAVNNVL